MMQRLAVLLMAGFLSALLVACSALPSPADRLTYADSLASENGWRGELIPSGSFILMSYAPANRINAPRLTVYIEGDGFAWLDSRTPSSDPTPRDPLGLRLALAQPEGNAAYLGRPCQFVQLAQAQCPERYWTGSRLAPEVVGATNRAVDILMARHGANRLTLVGYSGGGALAALLAARRDDVDQLITVAGNLDHRAWTHHHRVQPLQGSLNPSDEVQRLLRVDQWHLVGSEDRVVPPWLVESFANRFPASRRPVVDIKTGFDHQCCWAKHWPDTWRKVAKP